MKFLVRSTVTISLHAEVEAATKAEAEEAAMDLSMPSFCYGCSTAQEGCWSHSGEFDGEATDIKAEERK